MRLVLVCPMYSGINWLERVFILPILNSHKEFLEVVISNQTGLIQTIRASQKQVANKIHHIQEQLKKVEGLSSSQPWVSTGRISTVAELRSPHFSLKQALTNDLMLLKQQMRQLKNQIKTMNASAARQQADQFSSDFKKKLEEALKKAERSGGELDEGELETLSQQAGKVLEKHVTLLQTNPSTGNVKAVLENLEIPMLLGCNESTNSCDQAMNALAKAADTLNSKADKNFRNNPSSEKFEGLLQSQVLSQQLGGSEIKKPVGWQGVNKIHKVELGDSLSSISQDYYGKQAFWDVIYFENCAAIGDDPNALKIGEDLVIP